MEAENKNYTIGVLSDTHGRLAPGLGRMLEGVDLIIHAGDVDRPEILESLQSIAPVIAVCGNMDQGPWTEKMMKTELVEVQDTFLYVLHNLDDLDIDPEATGVQGVIYGHTHRPQIVTKGPIVFLNPGSTTLPRGHSPASMAIIRLRKGRLDTRLIKIEEV